MTYRRILVATVFAFALLDQFVEGRIHQNISVASGRLGATEEAADSRN